KPLVFDAIQPFFKLYGKEDSIEWHENRDPGTHNYQEDNRIESYRFFTKTFGLPLADREIPVGSELKGYDELLVGLPKNNLTILGLARKFATQIVRPPIPRDSAECTRWAVSERQKLAQVVRYKPVKITDAWALANTKNMGVETKSYLFQFNNGLGANGVW